MGQTKEQKLGHATLRAAHSPNRRKRWVAEVIEGGEQRWTQHGFISSDAALNAAEAWAAQHLDFKPRSAA